MNWLSLKSNNPYIVFLFSSLLICFTFSAFASSAFALDPVGYASVSGQVKDEITYQPLSGVKIKLICGSVSQEASTNASGHYEFSQVPIYKIGNFYLNKALILTIALEYKTEMRKAELMPNENYIFDFSLDTRFKYPILQGRVVDSVTASGISNATVTASNESNAYSGITDSQGYYKLRIENKGIGLYKVTAATNGYLDSAPQSLKTFPAHTYTLNFSLVKIILGVDVSPDYWHIGQISPNTVETMPTGLTVTNTGNGNVSYSLMVNNPPNWSISQVNVDFNQYILNAAFSDNPANITWNEANYALSTIAQKATNTKFAGDRTGVNVEPNAARKLWLQFKAPTATSITDEQAIQVIINAEAP